MQKGLRLGVAPTSLARAGEVSTIVAASAGSNAATAPCGALAYAVDSAAAAPDVAAACWRHAERTLTSDMNGRKTLHIFLGANSSNRAMAASNAFERQPSCYWVRAWRSVPFNPGD